MTGNIMLCRENQISLFTLNGALLLDQVVCDGSDDRVTACAFYEGASNEWLEKDLVFTGHKRGVVKVRDSVSLHSVALIIWQVWNKIIRGGSFSLDLIRQLNHVDNTREGEVNVLSGISFILPMPQVVYTGDEEGRVVSLIYDILDSRAAANVWLVRMGLCTAALTVRMHCCREKSWSSMIRGVWTAPRLVVQDSH